MIPIAPLPREFMARDREEEKKNDSQEKEDDSSNKIGHFERQTEFRFHPTAADKAGGIHVAAEKAREAQQKYEERLKEGGDHKKDDKSYMQKVEDELYDQGERERIARHNAKDDAHKYNEMVNKQIHQRCYEAEKEGAKMGRNALPDFHASRVNEIH